ncbi:MAG: phosphoenolpyruvate synthase [Patescibacteria group bacterium]
MKNIIAKNKKNILWFKEISIKDIALVGGKNASLGEMYNNLTKKGINIPNGFAITSVAYWNFLEKSGLKNEIKKVLKDLDISDVKNLNFIGEKIRNLILKSELPKELQKEIEFYYKNLSETEKVKNISVAVRSSATAEDLPDASFAGQQETYLNVCGIKELQLAVKKCIASLFTDRAISYRETKGFNHLDIALSVTVQTMVRSDMGSSGVMFTLDTESGFPGVVLINAAYGLGEYVVKGRVTPDQFYVFKEGIKQNKKAIISKILGTKEVKLIYSTSNGTKQEIVNSKEQNKFAISEDDVVRLAKWGMEIENYYKKPQDIEWAKDGKTGKLYIVQARPETVKSRENHNYIETYELKKKGKKLLSGVAVGQKIGAGKMKIIDDPKQMKIFKKGEVLVTRITDPDWEPIMRIASAIITEQGGKTSHAAIVSRELGVPCIVGAKNARKILKNKKQITVSCAEGDEGYIYDGILPFEVKKTEIKKVKETKTKIMMNVGDPDNAFSLSFLPNDGVGLAREEFIFSNFIRIHPLALVNYEKLKDKEAKKQIAEITRAYKNKSDYGIDRLAEGIARIATAFYPKDVIVRLSDFKTNEYATLIGGKEFEPKEENPMLGFRGASRYYSKEYKEGFKMECEAIKKVRNEFGLKNVIVMVPFCRTPEEGEKVLKTMESFGLKRNENDLKVYVMCEIPSNVILAEEFAKIFDGFSIGSNDLTQLTLGVDRDSSLVSHIYNERNHAVLKLIKDVIQVAHKYKRKVGICGQAPSDYPEFAEFLVRQNIDSISLNPDTVLNTRERISFVESTLGKRGNKTHKPSLGLLTLLGFLSAGILFLGSGCSLNNNKNLVEERLSMGNVRQNLTEKIETQKQNELDSHKSKLSINSFAHFTLDYPSKWSVENWSSGLNLSNGEQFVSIYKQIIPHPISDENKTKIIISNVDAYYYEAQGLNSTTLYIAEIPLSDYVLEINSNSKNVFDEILSGFNFVTDDEIPDRNLNHWDILDKRVCVQMITYAQKTSDSKCQAFGSPCEVPNGWSVCSE